MRNEFITKFNEQLDTATGNYTSSNDKVLDAVVDANRKVVEFAVKTVESITNAVEIPAMPKMPVELPFADRFEMPEFPTPAEAGKRYISFVERAADLNRDLNERVIEMLKVEGVKPVVKPATKPAAKKPAARKAAAKKTAKKAPARKAAAKK